MERAAAEAVAQRAAYGVTVHGGVPGIYIQFESPPDVELKLESLEDRRKGIELLTVQVIQREPEGPAIQLATVFVPDGQIKHFVTRFEQYATQQTEKGEPRHKELVDRILAGEV